MRTLSTLFLPWLRFFQVGLPHAGGICLLLQLSLVGWPLAVLWSMRERDRYFMNYAFVASALAQCTTQSPTVVEGGMVINILKRPNSSMTGSRPSRANPYRSGAKR